MSHSSSTVTEDAVPEAPAAPTAPAHGVAAGWLKNLAIISGLLAFLCFILVPFLPVNHTQSSVQWPQNESLNSVNAPLISVAPEEYNATIPLEAVDLLREDESLLLGTIPTSGPEATDRGMFVTLNDFGILDVTIMNDVVFELTPDELDDLPEGAVLEIEATGDGTTVQVPGTEHSETTEDDLRPQVTGVYTEIDATDENYETLVDAGLNVDVEINSRFTTSPTMVKQAAMWLGTLLAIVAVWALWRQDRADGRGHVKGPKRWRKLTPLDGIVGAVLGFWHIFGANTSDDGFILSMARVSDHAGYLANYYRWYGVPEAPFGTPFYELLALMTQLDSNSLWMRVPALIAGIGIWLLLSREILPRFGPGVDGRRVAHWTAAFMFLAFWLPYNNGIRPEPIIAFGTLLAWALFERSIATDRLFPAAAGTVVAAITLTCGPTGLMAVGVFLVAVPSLIRILARRVAANDGPRWKEYGAVLAPFLGAGTFVFVPVFADQTLATVLESTRVRGIVGPALEWYSEYVRYSTLFQQTVDGSLTRRFAMFTMLLCLGLVLYALMRPEGLQGAHRGPTVRLVLIVALSMFFLMFTPTKWTHHFGIYAGIAGALAALGAVVLSQIAIRSPRARTFALAAVTFLLAMTFAGWNGWWYVSSFGVPWWDKTPQLRGVEFTNILLAIALVILLVGVVQTFLHQYRRSQAKGRGDLADFDAADQAGATRWSTLMTAPIAVVSVLVVVFSTASFAKAFIDQYPAYSVGLGNVKVFGGDRDYLADEAMVETNTNDSFLTPVGDVTLAESLEADEIRGFGPNEIPDFIIPETEAAANVGAIADSTAGAGSTNVGGATTAGDDGAATGDATGETSTDNATANEEEQDDAQSEADAQTATADTSGGRREAVGVNGSNARLPFNLDPFTVPVVGSWEDEPNSSAEVTTAWYELPEATEEAPLLVVSAAGRIAHYDTDGVEQPGEELIVEYGATDADGEMEVLGEMELADIGPSPTWRNLRVPLEEFPEEADAVRIVAADRSLAPEDWIAFTPPRAPELTALSEVVDSEVPALLDWSAALQFPQQRPFDHYAGVTEIPEYRISPDHPGKAALSGFMDFLGGGSLATVEAVNTSYEVPSYTRDDWRRDWGSIQRYQPRLDSTGVEPDVAEIDTEEIRRSGIWQNSEMKIREP